MILICCISIGEIGFLGRREMEEGGFWKKMDFLRFLLEAPSLLSSHTEPTIHYVINEDEMCMCTNARDMIKEF